MSGVALAEDDAVGGWVEGEGYWTSKDNYEIRKSSSPTSHQGWKQVRERSGGKQYRAVGVTQWSKQHYTRAQMVGRVSGYVHADSYRVWGTDSTEARSPWISKNYQARTFYGSK